MEDNAMLNFFTDVSAEAYYYDAVLWAAENDITSGTAANIFSPISILDTVFGTLATAIGAVGTYFCKKKNP